MHCGKTIYGAGMLDLKYTCIAQKTKAGITTETAHRPLNDAANNPF